MQVQERTLYYEIPCRPWKIIGADVLMINGKNLLCIVDNHSKFAIVKKVNSLSVDYLLQNIDFSRRLFLMWVQNSWLRYSKPSAERLTIQQTITSLNHHQSNGQV